MSRAVRWGDTGYIKGTVDRGRKIRRGLIELEAGVGLGGK
jgi:hypothetical protein